MNNSSSTAKIIHVRNFPETCSQQQIRECFTQYGEIVECLILHDSYAFVHFKLASDARLALQSTNNTQFMSQTLLVQYSRSKFKQQNTPSQQSHALDHENGLGAGAASPNGYYNVNANGYNKRSYGATTYDNNNPTDRMVVQQQQQNDSNLTSNRNSRSLMPSNKLPIKYQPQAVGAASSKQLVSSTARSLSTENVVTRGGNKMSLTSRKSGTANTSNGTGIRNYKVALGLNLANVSGQNQKKSNNENETNANGT